MTNEADPGETRNRTEALNILLDFVCESFSHFEDVSLCLVLIGRGGKEDGIWVHY
jgi:hypothetical protein